LVINTSRQSPVKLRAAPASPFAVTYRLLASWSLARVGARIRTEGPLRYCRPGVLPVNPARRNASAIASPLAGTELLRPARVSAGRRRFSDSVGWISARAVVGRASGA